MAISKTQNERPAIIALIDASNQAEIDINNLEDGLSAESEARELRDIELQSAIATEISNRTAAVNNLQGQITEEVSNRTSADTNIQNQIGDGFGPSITIAQSLSATNSQVSELSNDVYALENVSVPALETFVNRFRIGATEQITVEAGNSYSGSLVYQTPYESTDLTIVVLGFADDLVPADVTINLVGSTYSGFSYSVSNTGSDDADIRIGFLTVKVN